MSAVPMCKDDPELGGYVSMRRASTLLNETRYTLWKLIAGRELEMEMIGGRPFITIASVNRVLATRHESAMAAEAAPAV